MKTGSNLGVQHLEIRNLRIPFAETLGTSHEDSLLSEMSQSQKDKHYRTPLREAPEESGPEGQSTQWKPRAGSGVGDAVL